MNEISDAYELPSALRAVIEQDAREAEAQGNMTTRMCNALRDAGAFRLLTPREFGGWEIALTAGLTILEEFGRVNASAAALVWGLNMGFVGGLLPQSGARRIFDGRHEPILAYSPTTGFAHQVRNGYEISGRWPAVSGVDFAEWVVLVVMVTEGGRLRRTDSGDPQPWFMVVHRDQFDIDFSWDVTALRATGSNGIVLENAFVTADLAVPVDGPPTIDRALYRGYPPALVFPGCSAVLLGVTHSALEEMISLVVTGKASDGGRAAGNQRVQYLVANSDAELSAARLLLLSTVRSLQTSAERGETVTAWQRAHLRAAMTHTAQVCSQVLMRAYELAGPHALYRSNRIESLVRDGMALVQNEFHSARFLELFGRVRLGLEPDLPLY